MKYAVLVAAALVAALVIVWATRAPEPVAKTDSDAVGFQSVTAIVAISLPNTLSENATLGKTLFDQKCAACHGANAVGQLEVAPPLVHLIYEPSHHGDEAFQRAVANGVRGHHWPFGGMPPIKGLTRADVAMITAYIRELQQYNGIN